MASIFIFKASALAAASLFICIFLASLASAFLFFIFKATFLAAASVFSFKAILAYLRTSFARVLASASLFIFKASLASSEAAVETSVFLITVVLPFERTFVSTSLSDLPSVTVLAPALPNFLTRSVAFLPLTTSTLVSFPNFTAFLVFLAALLAPFVAFFTAFFRAFVASNLGLVSTLALMVPVALARAYFLPTSLLGVSSSSCDMSFCSALNWLAITLCWSSWLSALAATTRRMARPILYVL